MFFVIFRLMIFYKLRFELWTYGLFNDRYINIIYFVNRYVLFAVFNYF